MPSPSPDTLYAWADRWSKIRADAYAALVASYTPEQRALMATMNHASHQKKLCWDRARWPEGSTRKHPTLIRWPDEPPQPRA